MPMKTLYNTVSTRLQTVAAIKMIDFDMGQLELLEQGERPPVIFPCALVDINYPTCEDESDTIQQVTALVKVRLGFEQQMPTDSLATEIRRNAGLAVFDTVNDVYKAIQGFSDSNFSAFSRRSQSTDPRFVGIKVIEIIFETTFEDLSAD